MNNTIHMWRDTDRRASELEKDFALHRQAMQYQISELSKRLEALEKRKPGLGSQIVGFLLSPTFQKFAIGSGSGVGAWILSRLIG